MVSRRLNTSASTVLFAHARSDIIGRYYQRYRLDCPYVRVRLSLVYTSCRRIILSCSLVPPLCGSFADPMKLMHCPIVSIGLIGFCTRPDEQASRFSNHRTTVIIAFIHDRDLTSISVGLRVYAHHTCSIDGFDSTGRHLPPTIPLAHWELLFNLL